MRWSSLATMTILVLTPLGACGSGDLDESTRGGARTLVAYSREGGIRFQSSTLVVKTKGFATMVGFDGCTTRFRLGARSWGRLRRALEQADLSTLAGDYPAPSGAADVITETVVVGGDAVRIGDFASLPVRAQRELAPLLGVLGEARAEGARRARPPCEHGRSGPSAR